tara:strand:- start:120 stop:710 length:591 start_codon:yes stop_codon:yes gene_type:complete
MKKLLGISILVLLISGNTYGQETQLICSFDNDCKNKSYDQCKKDHYVKDKKIFEDITNDEIENNWLKLTMSHQIFDDKLISTMGLSSDAFILSNAKVDSDKYYVFYRAILISENRARFQLRAFDRNELISLLKNFDTSINSDGSINWPEDINNEKKLLDYVNYMFIKYKNPKYDNRKYVYQSPSICKISGNVKPKF